MYKRLIELFTVALILTACNSNSPEGNDTENIESEDTLITEENQETQTNREQPDTPNKGNQKDVAYLLEYDKIIEQIGKKNYTFTIEEDNADKRILIIKFNNEKQYKTIFIKNTNRLKIIQIKGGEIFNEILK